MASYNLSISSSVVISQANTCNFSPTSFYLNSTIQDRLLYLKEAAISPALNYFNLYGSNTTIADSNNVVLSNGAAMVLHLSTNVWHILGGIRPGVFSPPYDHGIFPQMPYCNNYTPVYPAMDTSRYFLDLRTESKLVFLPPPLNTPGQSPIYTFKDVFGKADTNFFFISTNNAAVTLENANFTIPMKLASNYTSVDLLYNKNTNHWNFVNYYGGDVLTETTGFGNTDPPTSVYISTSLTFMTRKSDAVADINKIAMLPVAETVIGQSFYIANIGHPNNASFSMVSTQIGDYMDDRLSSIFLSNRWESIQLVAHSSTRYSITANWKLGAAPFV